MHRFFSACYKWKLDTELVDGLPVESPSSPEIVVEGAAPVNKLHIPPHSTKNTSTQLIERLTCPQNHSKCLSLLLFEDVIIIPDESPGNQKDTRRIPVEMEEVLSFILTIPLLSEPLAGARRGCLS